MARATDTPFTLTQMELVLSALPDAAIATDENGFIVAMNELARSIVGDAAVGRHLTATIRAPGVLQAINDAVRLSKASRAQQILRAPVERTIDIHVSPMGTIEGGGRATLLVMRDLTREEQIERMRADFVANASHELRTPLAALTGFIETLGGAARNDAAARDRFLDLMKAQADRMARLIDDLLSLSRIEISEHVPPNETADLAVVVRQAVELLGEAARQAECEIRLSMPPKMMVTGDFGQLSQVVTNLVENAIKYAADGKVVEVNGTVVNGMAKVTVADHGPGIAPRHVPRLTERFYRVSVQDSRMRGGTGLGLAIAKHIVNRHRGRLTIESEPGKGSRFSIFIPLSSN